MTEKQSDEMTLLELQRWDADQAASDLMREVADRYPEMYDFGFGVSVEPPQRLESCF